MNWSLSLTTSVMSEDGCTGNQQKTRLTPESNGISGVQNEYIRNGTWPRIVIYRLATKRENPHDLLGLLQNNSTSREIVIV